MTTGAAGQHVGEVGEVPKRLTARGVPVDPDLRILATATLVNTFGNGALMTTFALYFTRLVGLRPTEVGLALSAGALAGLLIQVPAGHLADLRGPRKVLQGFTFGASLAILGLLFARSVWALVAVIAVVSLFDRGARAVLSGYVARIAEGGQGVQFKAHLRAMTNVGISLASGQPSWLAVLLLCVGALVHVVGEMIGSGGQWGVQMAWPRENARGSTRASPGWASPCREWSPPLWSSCCASSGAVPAGS